MKYNNVLELIGVTPIVRLNKVNYDSGAVVWVKLEKFNPGGSVKDRVALYMIEQAEREGIVQRGDTIVEPTSGNTGIGLAMVAAVKGYRLILTMPSSMSSERVSILRAYGAEVVLTDPAEGMAGAIAAAEEFHRRDGYFVPSQFENVANPLSHYDTTAREIIADLPGLDVFVAGVGTGGTTTGVGRYLREYTDARIVAVEPAQSPVLQGGAPSAHRIQGIGAGFIPKNYDPTYVDQVVGVDQADALAMMRRLAQEEGLLVGVSAAAAIHVAVEQARRLTSDESIVVLAPDGGERYLSLDIF